MSFLKSNPFSRGNAKEAILNDYKGAISDFDKAIELNPKDADAYICRGTAKAILNDYKGAILDYDKYIELNPKDKNSSLFEGDYEKFRMNLLKKK